MPLNILGDLYGVGMRALDSYVQGAVNEHWAKKARAENYTYNEKAADNADARQRKQFEDMYSLPAQMQQIHESGLSPSIMAGGNMPSTQGATGAHGGGAAGLMGPYMSSFDAGVAADIELKQAQAAKLREETKTEAGDNERGKGEISNLFAEGNKILAETGNLELSSEFLKAQTTWQTIQNRFAEPMAQMKLKLFDADYKQIIATTENIVEQAKQQKMQNKITAATIDKQIELVGAELQKTLAETSLLFARKNESVKNLKLMDAQINKLKNDILQGWKDLEIKGADQKAHQAFYEAQARNWLRMYNLEERKFSYHQESTNKSLELQRRQQNMNFATDCIQAFVSSQNALLYTIGNVISGFSPASALGGAAKSAIRVGGFK